MRLHELPVEGNQPSVPELKLDFTLPDLSEGQSREVVPAQEEESSQPQPPLEEAPALEETPELEAGRPSLPAEQPQRAPAWSASAAGGEIERLAAQLLDFERKVRTEACRKLGDLGDSRAIPLLVDTLQIDRDYTVQAEAIACLGRLGASEAGDVIVSYLSGGDWWVRATAAKVLGDLDCKGAAVPLAEHVTDSNQFVRQEIGIALGKLQAVEVIPRLIRLLPDPGAVFALIQMGPPVITPLLNWMASSDLSFLTSRLALDHWESVAEAWPESLGQAFGYSDPTSDDSMTAAAAGSRFIAATSVLAGLGSIALYRLRSEGVAHKDRMVRLVSVEALRRIGDPQSVLAISQAARQDPAPEVRLVALMALLQFKDVRAVPALIQTLKDEETIIRRHAANGLGLLGDWQATEHLLGAVTRDPDPGVQNAAVAALGALRDKTAVPVLSDLLRRHTDAGIREQAATSLGKIGDREGVPLLLAALGRDKSEQVRAAAATALGALKDPRAIGPLRTVAMSRDEDRLVQQAAHDALMRVARR